MRPQDAFFSREDHYSLGIDLDTRQHFASLPVSNGLVDYEEHFVLTDQQYAHFLSDPVAAVAFIEECRRREHDDLLMQKPGWNRGTPV